MLECAATTLECHHAGVARRTLQWPAPLWSAPRHSRVTSVCMQPPRCMRTSRAACRTFSLALPARRRTQKPRAPLTRTPKSRQAPTGPQRRLRQVTSHPSEPPPRSRAFRRLPRMSARRLAIMLPLSRPPRRRRRAGSAGGEPTASVWRRMHMQNDASANFKAWNHAITAEISR